MPVLRALNVIGRLIRSVPPPPADVLEAYAHEVIPVLDRAEWLYEYWLEQSTLFTDSEKLGNVAAIHRWETATMGRSLERVIPPPALADAHASVIDALEMASRAAQLLSSGSRFHNANAVCEGQAMLTVSRERRLAALKAMRRHLSRVPPADTVVTPEPATPAPAAPAPDAQASGAPSGAQADTVPTDDTTRRASQASESTTGEPPSSASAPGAAASRPAGQAPAAGGAPDPQAAAGAALGQPPAASPAEGDTADSDPVWTDTDEPEPAWLNAASASATPDDEQSRATGEPPDRTVDHPGRANGEAPPQAVDHPDRAANLPVGRPDDGGASPSPARPPEERPTDATAAAPPTPTTQPGTGATGTPSVDPERSDPEAPPPDAARSEPQTQADGAPAEPAPHEPPSRAGWGSLFGRSRNRADR